MALSRQATGTEAGARLRHQCVAVCGDPWKSLCREGVRSEVGGTPAACASPPLLACVRLASEPISYHLG